MISRAEGLDRARAIVGRGGRIAFPPDLGEPDLVADLPDLLDDATAELVLPHRVRSTELGDLGPRVTIRAIFGAASVGADDYVSLPIEDLPRMIDAGLLPIDVALVRLSPADKQGNHCVGPSATLTTELVRNARAVIAEIDPDLPLTSGDTRVPASRIAVALPARDPLETPALAQRGEAAEVADRLSRFVAELIPDRAYISVGIGGIAQAIVRRLAGHRGLRLHSGLISPELREFLESEACDPDWRPIMGEAIGPRSLMDYIDGNERLNFQGTRRIHNPQLLAGYDRFVTVNTVRSVDLRGQAACEGSPTNRSGGLGGLIAFLVGARLSPGGRTILALTSLASDGSSRIRAALAPGEVSVPSYLVDFVVTEHGIADLRGTTQRETAERLLAIAHPSAQSLLTKSEGECNVRSVHS